MPNTQKPHLLIVEARFYDDLADALLDGAKAALDEAGATYDVATVPGALEIPAVISFALDGAHPHDVCQILDGRGVALRGGHHCAQPLMDRFGLTGTARASLALYNDDTDIDALLSGLDEAARRLR